LIDAYTHYIWTFPIRNKSDVQSVICSFFSYVHTQFHLPILALQIENGREFNTHVLRSFVTTHDTSFHLSCPYTSQQNGNVERILHKINGYVRILRGVEHSDVRHQPTPLLLKGPCDAQG
jgi:hypothetical protein